MSASDNVSGPTIAEWDETVEWNGLELNAWGPDGDIRIVTVLDADYLHSQLKDWVDFESKAEVAGAALLCRRVYLHNGVPCRECLQAIVDIDTHADEIHKEALNRQWRNRHDHGDERSDEE